MNEHLLNPEALEKAYAAYYANSGFHSEKIKAAIRTYLASLPERDSLALSAIAEEKAKTRALGRAEAAEAEVARLKAERDELLGEVKRLAISEAVETRSAEEHEAENARLKAELERLHELDTCMCGSRMDDHDIGSGHSPVSMYDYYRSQDEAEIKRLKAELAEGCDLLDRFDGHLPTVRRYLERVRSFRDRQGEASE